MSEPTITLEQIEELLLWQKRLGSRTPILALGDTDDILLKSLRESSAYWFRDEQATHPAAVENFIRQFFDSLRVMEPVERIDVMNRVRLAGGYVSTGAGGISGVNRYDADRSRADGSLIKRRRR